MATSKTGFTVAADKHAQVVMAQREFIDLIAERVEKGEPIARAGERKMIAGILRAWARQLPDTLPSRIDPGYAAIHFAFLVNGHGLSKDAATKELAGLYGVSSEDVVEAIAKFEAPALRLVPKKKAKAPSP